MEEHINKKNLNLKDNFRCQRYNTALYTCKQKWIEDTQLKVVYISCSVHGIYLALNNEGKVFTDSDKF